ncbi:hypothetical protein PR048_015235 [Dryococelus australis]|uniref:HAT C-terminal dimerisation domain-containing protein n=1 Tax=Dryococelus australis TaxID=614101 RepID=A0ABQ9HGD2_9NEOP|nr:hypothetical protein PR048_015235 [Dryococelus australis]
MLLRFAKEDVVSSLKIFDESIIAENSNFAPIVQVECVDRRLAKSRVFKITTLLPTNILSLLLLSPKDILKYLICLHPDYISSSDSSLYITKLGNLLPINVDNEVLLDEWKLRNLITERRSTYRPQLETVFFFSKHPSVATLVKACLSLSHSSADVDRSFSLSGRLLAEDRATMSSKMLDAKLTIL